MGILKAALGGCLIGLIAGQQNVMQMMDRPVDLGYFKGPFMPQNGKMEVCNSAGLG